MPITKCDFCGTKGTRHSGIFSCANDLMAQMKILRPKLKQAEDLLFWVVVSGMMDAFVQDYELEENDYEKIEDIKKFTGFDEE
jgi:hypothetical protein